MPSIRELIGALCQRDGVEAAIVLGRDGLLIDSQAAPGLDAESVAALAPSVATAADELGASAELGAVTTAILEYPRGLAVVSVLSADAMLVVLARAGANAGKLLFELRRNREHIASLV
jgi:predicted regulator of Ras-like GTPase activity (Roadblock/LC7/MglB family)